ncbi:MAG: hypothetical protein QMC81_07310 [Thermoanaerobacterales bacterium]|nr:hypothetical protein [Thermoanaerobacterales bacterium]
MRVGVVDIGTNSVRLLVAEVTGREIKELERDLRTTRLGEGPDGLLRPEAMARTVRAVGELAARMRAAGAARAVLAGTAAVREAANREEFAGLVRKETGLALRVLTGEEEALLGYRGAVWGLSGRISGPVVTMDIGGGSTEFAWEDGEGRLRYLSLPVGAVRMTERSSTMNDVRELLKPAVDALRESGQGAPRKLVGMGGTVTTLAAMAQGLRRYDPGRVHGYPLHVSEVERLLAALQATLLEERRRMPGLQPERADIIPAGAMIALAAMRGLGRAVMYVCQTDILHGLALAVARDVETKSLARD